MVKSIAPTKPPRVSNEACFLTLLSEPDFKIRYLTDRTLITASVYHIVRYVNELYPFVVVWSRYFLHSAK